MATWPEFKCLHERCNMVRHFDIASYMGYCCRRCREDNSRYRRAPHGKNCTRKPWVEPQPMLVD